MPPKILTSGYFSIQSVGSTKYTRHISQAMKYVLGKSLRFAAVSL